MDEVKRGELYYADLSPVVGSEQGGIRPVLILQNDKTNKNSTTTIVAAMTSQIKNNLQTHVKVSGHGLKKESLVLLEQIRTIDKVRLMQYIGRLGDKDMKKIDRALTESLSIKKSEPCSYRELKYKKFGGAFKWITRTVRFTMKLIFCRYCCGKDISAKQIIMPLSALRKMT